MLLSFADDDLQDQLDDVQTRMAEQSEKKAQAQMVIDNVSDKLYEIQKSLEAAQGEYRTVTADLAATEEKIAATQPSSTRTGPAWRSGRKSLPGASATSTCMAS